MCLVPSFQQLLQPFQSQMTAPTFASLLTILAGWVLCRRHTVTGALAAAGEYDKHFCAYHRVFAAARWSLEAVGLAMAGMILGLIAAASGGVIFLVVDDTLCRKRGRKVFGAGMHYDAALTGRRLSNANASLKSRGHCWVVLGIVVQFPFRPGHCYCLPVLFRLYLNNKSAKRHRKAYRTKPQLALEMLRGLCTAFPRRRFHLLADSAYGGKHLLGNLPDNCDFTCRWILNAALYAPAPARVPGSKGRRRVRGERLAGVRQMLAGRCEHLELDLYGQRRGYRVAVVRGCCFHAVPGKRLCVVAAEPLSAAGTPLPGQRAVFYSTVAHAASAQQVLGWYAMRWSIEVSIHDAKQQLGLAQAQSWSAPAVQRCAPTLLMLYSLVVLWFAQEGHRRWRPAPRAWYASKRHPSFADMLGVLREQMLRERFRPGLRTILNDRDHGPLSRNAIKSLLRLVKQAA
jgi:hypothetical protein